MRTAEDMMAVLDDVSSALRTSEGQEMFAELLDTTFDEFHRFTYIVAAYLRLTPSMNDEDRAAFALGLGIQVGVCLMNERTLQA